MLSREIGVASLLTALSVASGGCESDRSTGSATTKEVSMDARAVDGIFDVKGGGMHLHCSGTGSPTAVFDSALGQDGSAWHNVAPLVARMARVCVYDRKGLGYSAAPSTKPHTVRQMADELHALLVRGSIAGPYVLVGHSIGGITMRLFASSHPDDVSGMVLVEAADDPTLLWSLMPKEALEKRREELAKSPEGLDYDSFVAGANAMHAESKTLGDMPLIVLSRGQSDAPPSTTPDVAAHWLERWNAQQIELPRLSTNSVRVVAPNSGHMMPAQAPALVVAAVGEVLNAVRTHSNVRDSALLPFVNGPNGT